MTKPPATVAVATGAERETKTEEIFSKLIFLSKVTPLRFEILLSWSRLWWNIRNVSDQEWEYDFVVGSEKNPFISNTHQQNVIPSQDWIQNLWFQVEHYPCWGNLAFACKTETLGSLYSHVLLILMKSFKSKNQVVHELKFKDQLSSTCQVRSERLEC